VFITEKYQAAH